MLRRGVSLLPSLFTTGNIFLGFWASVRTLQGEYGLAAPLILWAIVLDMLDGRIARMTNTTSEFGAELDSLADVVSFGVAPGLLVYAWAFSTMPRLGWLAAFLFVICGTLRLARFNVQRSVVDGRYFVGLPIPAAAGQVAVWVNVFPNPLRTRYEAAAALGALVLFSLLMVSTLRYPSGKKFDLRARRSYLNILGIALFFLLIALHPAWVLLAFGTVYWLWAPVAYALSLIFRSRREAAPAPAGGPAS